MDKARVALQSLAVANQLLIKAFSAKTLEELNFIVLNDTIHFIRYERASLWDMQSKIPTLKGVSGQATVNQGSEMAIQVRTLIESLPDKTRPQILTKESFPEQAEIWSAIAGAHSNFYALFFPIKVNEEPALGLWLEQWDTEPDAAPPNEVLEMLANILIPGYGHAYEKFRHSWLLKKLATKKVFLGSLLALLLLLFAIRIPLRIVAPCEVIPEDPYVITSPLEGIVEEVLVKPGEFVNEGVILFTYDKRAPLKELKVAEKQLAAAEAEANRAQTLGLNDKKSLTDLAILNQKVEKEKVNVQFARYQAGLLNVKSPIAGIVILDNPEEWRGKPVKIGEKVLTVSDPSRTKVRIWIPEQDNIILAPQETILVILSIDPAVSYTAKLIYIGNEAALNGKKVPSFIAEAAWVTAPKNVKLGLTGTAILYGEKVSLFYFLLRKPWGIVRNFFGI